MSESQEPQATSSVGTILRLHWMLIGNAALFFLAVLIASRKFSSLLIPSLSYWAVVISIMAARYIDIRHMNGETADGKPATVDDWKRYSLIVGLAASAAWTISVFIFKFASGK